MTDKNHSPARSRTASLVVVSALALSAPAVFADDPLLGIKLFRDADVMFRDADMSRWADNYVELGLGYNSKDSLRFGQFSGLTDKGAFPLAGFNWLSRDNANDASYWHVYGSNLGLDSRKLLAETGLQGNWNVSFSFDQLKKSQTDTASFIYQGLGSNNLTLAPGCGGAANATAINTACLSKFDIQQGRDIYRLGTNGVLPNNWEYKLTYREDQRDGTRLTGAPFTGAGGATRAVIVPYQIDDKTQQIEATLSYATKTAQLQLGYTYSRYKDALNTFTWANAFAGAPANTPNNRMSLMPSNDYHQFNATGAYMITRATRLTARLSRGVAQQNAVFLPYTTDVTSAQPVSLPRGSLDGKVVNTLLDVALTTKPVDKMNLKVGYQYRDSDNRTPVAQYVYASRDGAQGSTGAVNSSTVRTNAPVSTTEQKFVVDGDYAIAPRTLLRAGLDHTYKKYTLTDRTSTRTDKLSLELRRPVGNDFLGSLGYAYTQRRGSDYDKNAYFRNTYTDTTFQNGANGRLTNNPSMRSFMYGDLNENRLRASGNWTISETVSLQSALDAYKQDSRGPDCGLFSDTLQSQAITTALSGTCLGRARGEGGSVNVDLQWQPSENLTTFAFVNLSQTGVDETGRQWTRNNASGALDTFNWVGKMTYRDQTLGFGLKWQPVERWDLGGTYVLNHGSGKNDVSAGSALAAAAPVPDTWNRLHSLQLFAKMAYSKQMDLRFNYMYENLRSYDWAYDNLAATSVQNVLLTGQSSPRYSNHVFGVSAVVKSW